ncbi:MAG: hypothetical protein MJ252_15195 [archaeon]|nr:hypothetical protein [archaeon]
MEEFLQAAIDINLNTVSMPKQCINCFEDLKYLILDPMFKKADAICDNEEVSAEELWFMMKYLNRGTENYNMYKCDIFLRGNLRTSAVNDFILKMRNQKYGSLLRHEFNTGIMYGFLNRQVRNNTLEMEDKFNFKNRRYIETVVNDNNNQEKKEREIKRKTQILMQEISNNKGSDYVEMNKKLEQSILNPKQNELFGINAPLETKEKILKEIEAKYAPNAFKRADMTDNVQEFINNKKEEDADVGMRTDKTIDFNCQRIVKYYEQKEIAFGF